MNSQLRSFRSFALLATVFASITSHAVVATTSTNTADLTADLHYNFVYKLGSASAVAVSPNAILTANHVFPGGITTGTVTLGGIVYNIDHTVSPDYVITSGPDAGQASHVDLTLIVLKNDKTLPGFYNIANTLLPTNVTMVGYGASGVVNGSGTGYSVNVGSGTRRSGDNVLDFQLQNYVDPSQTGNAGVAGGPLLGSFLRRAGDAVLATNDSGGGWFQGDTLIGINSAVNNFTGFSYEKNGSTVFGKGLPDYGFQRSTSFSYDSNGDGILDATVPANTPYFASLAIDLTDPQIQTFLIREGVIAAPVPEPASLLALSAGVVALLRRRRKA